MVDRGGLYPTQTVAVYTPKEPRRGFAVRFVGRTEPWALRTVRFVGEPWSTLLVSMAVVSTLVSMAVISTVVSMAVVSTVVSMAVVSTVVSIAVVSTVLVRRTDPKLILLIFLWFRALGMTQTFSSPVLTVVFASYVLLSPVFLNSSAD